MGFLLLFLIVTVPAALLVLGTRQQKKRGCGRGCATCGNREICYRKSKRSGQQ